MVLLHIFFFSPIKVMHKSWKSKVYLRSLKVQLVTHQQINSNLAFSIFQLLLFGFFCDSNIAIRFT